MGGRALFVPTAIGLCDPPETGDDGRIQSCTGNIVLCSRQVNLGDRNVCAAKPI